MCKLFIGALIALFSYSVYANCIGQSIVGSDGVIKYCQTCCVNGQCVTVCN
jgi:hypothetical protein